MDYQYALDILTDDGRELDRVVVTPDWDAALEWVRFEGIREGRLPPVSGAVPGVVQPVWDVKKGQPFVAAFRVIIPSQGEGDVSREVPRSYLQSYAQEAAAKLVEKGMLQAGASFRYVVSAFPVADATAVGEPQSGGFSIEEIVQPLALAEASLGPFLRDAVFAGAREPAGHVPVFVPRRVLDEAVELARAAGDFETGGVLVGSLRRDASAPEVFVEVTAQIPAPHTLSRSTKLTFTGETWAAVQAALDLRKRKEIMLGWWHFHPDFCRLRNCPMERRKRCTGASPFFSAEDVHLHATCFPSAYHVALLISDSTAAGGMTWSLFGWSQGMVTARGFHVLNEKGDDAHATHATPGF
jgi:proteasome lid subunit RPN8/RPN11